jgi:Mrp family chromosome partitioning ATPase
MSRNFAVLGKTPVQSSPESPPVPSALHPGEYTELIQRLFQAPSVVAIIGAGSGAGVTAVCEEIASELSLLGRHVVVVSVQRLLPMDPITLPDETAFMPGSARNVWHWPSPAGRQIEFFKPRLPVGGENWLDALRRNFDSVLLDCPAVETAPLGVAIAARADAALLAVEAANTPKNHILRDQRSLEMSGAKLAGCILIT